MEAADQQLQRSSGASSFILDSPPTAGKKPNTKLNQAMRDVYATRALLSICPLTNTVLQIYSELSWPPVCSSALTSEVSQGLVSQAVKAALFNQSRARTPNILRALAQVSAPLPGPHTDAAVGARPLLEDSSPTREVATPTTRMDVEWFAPLLIADAQIEFTKD